MTGNEAREIAKRKARYGHSDWIIWKDGADEYHAAKASAATVKQALLAVGTQGRFNCYQASNAWSHSYSWRMGINFMQHLQYYEKHGHI